MKKIDYITPIKKELEKELHIVCQTFMMVGSPRETPRYYNISNKTHEQLDGSPFNIGKNDEQYYLYIQSTQVLSTSDFLMFKIKVTADYYKSLWKTDGGFWEQFKEFRTKFLIKHYPTINPY